MKKPFFVLAVVIASLAGGYTLITPATAQSHADICQANYDQCIKGCDGAQSCSNQCQANKDGCNSQGQ